MAEYVGLRAFYGRAEYYGSCNFCTRRRGPDGGRVLVVESDDPDRRQSVRICEECCAALKAAMEKGK